MKKQTAWRRWWRAAETDDKARVADEAGTTPGYLSALASGYGLPSKALAERLEAATGGQVLAAELRPARALPSDLRDPP